MRQRIRDIPSFKKINELIFVLVIVVLGITFAVHQSESDWTATGTVCMAGLAGIGIVYSNLTIVLMREENRPFVYVNLITDDIYRSMVDVELGNYGKGAACHLSIEISAPEKEAEMVKKKDILQKISDMSIFKEEIHFLPPGKSIKVMYGLGPFLEKHSPLEYTFKLSYEDLYHKSYSEEIKINPTYLADCSVADKKTDSFLKKIENDLDQIHQDLNELNDSIKLLSKQRADSPDDDYQEDEIEQRDWKSTDDNFRNPGLPPNEL